MGVSRKGIAAIALLVLVALCGAGQPATNLTGKVVGVSDGDTLTVLDSSQQQHKIRLEGIDAPEGGQPFGTQAKKALSDKVFQKEVKVEVLGKDKYGRLLGDIHLNERWINLELVAEGWAWHYKQYSSSKSLADTEKAARLAGVGLWADKKPIPPWGFRHTKPTAPKAYEAGPDRASACLRPALPWRDDWQPT